MRGGGWVGAIVPYRRGMPRTLGFALVVSLTLLLVPTAAASAYGVGSAVSWSNGVVLCDFAPAAPSVAVSHATASDTGLTVSLLSLAETGADQLTVAEANLTGLVWSVENLSTDDAFDLAYTVHAPLVGPSPGSRVVGWANLSVQFVLPAYEGVPQGPTNEVTVLFEVQGWTWQAAGDHLTLSFAAAPSFPSLEHLNQTAAPGWMLASTSNTSGSVLERFGANSSATTKSSAGVPASVAANATLAIASSAWAQVTVAFGNSAGAFASLEYAAHVGVVLPTTIAGIPLPDLLAIAGVGIGVSLAVAVLTQRIRRRPSTLIYVSPEERTP